MKTNWEYEGRVVRLDKPDHIYVNVDLGFSRWTLLRFQADPNDLHYTDYDDLIVFTSKKIGSEYEIKISHCYGEAPGGVGQTDDVAVLKDRMA